MPGLYSSISNDQDIVFADNADFSGADIPSQANGLQDDGQLWIGRTTVPVGETHVVVGNITSSSLTVDFSDPNITIETNGGGAPVEEFILQSGTTPVVPNASGQVGFIGGIDVAGTNPIRSFGVSAFQMAVVAQMSQAIAATDPTKIGLCNFDSADFAVDANGFVTLTAAGSGVETITGDSGGALSPTGGTINVLGRSGSKTSGSGSTLTVKSPPYSDQAGSTSVTLNSGSFATNAITLTTPVSAGLLDGDKLEFVATNGVLVIQLAATQVAHLGTSVTSVAGTITGSATGDSISLRYQASTNDWWATSSCGVWLLA